MPSLQDSVQRASEEGRLLPASAANIAFLLRSDPDPLNETVIAELIGKQLWGELDNRFFQRLSFGTGGLRGRTIGRFVAEAERGEPGPGERPQFPCIGTNAVNTHNIRRVTRGLIAYIRLWLAETGSSDRPRLAISHDTRHFSREFAELTARTAIEEGCDVYLVDGPRSTPQLSFAVRHYRTHAGVMITASHNPPHDNGYKVYFEDGALIVEPHASGIIDCINGLEPGIHTAAATAPPGALTPIGADFDTLYLDRLQTLVLQPEVLRHSSGVTIVFTSLHGTGAHMVRPVLERAGVRFRTVPEQDIPDGRFPTVESPNPENAAALAMAIDLAEREQADIVLGTDPDCDRMGAGARDGSGQMRLFTGNQVGSLLAWYRTSTFFDQGVLHPGNRERAVIVKTFVTTGLQSEIARDHGINVVNTLTGFKYIGAKLTKYERQLPDSARAAYRDLDEIESRRLRLEHSRFFVFGGEESYGYLGADFIRDKDANGAVLMFCELAAYARSLGKTAHDLLEDLYLRYGYFEERQKSVTFDGVEGAARIRRLADSFTGSPPTALDGSPVSTLRNFAAHDYVDEEGDPVPRESMILVDLADGRRFAVRPSGTEPKIKYYLFGRSQPVKDSSKGPGALDALDAAREQVGRSLDTLWSALEIDIEQRLTS
ncbi:MAG TPA: phospho-sugar mutase [Verrucomicrobiales bacterium]|nr:phospho-sugar mutase [Verrucomicrobiales bacterium]